MTPSAGIRLLGLRFWREYCSDSSEDLIPRAQSGLAESGETEQVAMVKPFLVQTTPGKERS